MNFSRVRVLIVDDEPLARRRLGTLVAELDWAEVVGEASDGRAAAEAIDTLLPDLVFLDVQMPGLTGIQVVEMTEHQPVVVFTTAFDRYAVTAFELQALDYIVKPFGRDRFRKAADRARAALSVEVEVSTGERAANATGLERLSTIFVRGRRRIIPIEVARIERLQAQRDYVSIHIDGKEHLLTTTLGGIIDRLDSALFVRVHRSHAVNIQRVREMVPYDGGRLMLTMSDGTEIIASRGYSKELRRMVL